MPIERIIADAGYGSKANHRFYREELGVRSLIPAKKRRSVKVVATAPYRQEMVRPLSDPAMIRAGRPTASAGRPRPSCRP
jgi:hypothetical protein